MSQRKTSVVWIAGAALILLLSAYVGIYLIKVNPMRRTAATGDGPLIIPARIFTPIHWLDRQLRPHIWKP
jgi:hypothetical protein